MSYGVTIPLYRPAYHLYGGVGQSSELPGLWDVALNGIGYLVDWNEGIRHVSIPQVREQSDSTPKPGEASISREELWRVGQETWHKGAGQAFLDRADSDEARFNSSKGVYVWDRFELSLLPDTDEKRNSANTNLALAVGSSKVYVADGNDVLYATDITGDSPTFTDTVIQAGEAAQSVQAIASDGHNLYAALGSNGIHRSVNGAAAAHYSDLAASLVRWVKGRLMAAGNTTNAYKMYNVTASGAAPSSLMEHDNTSFVWRDFAEGRGYIYAGGSAGDKSEIWKTAVKADGTALDTPSPAGALPDGEILRSLYGYLGFLVIGTDNGIRLAVEGDDGNLTIGALIETDSAVRCFEGQGRFIWFGWTNYDGTSTGLGRMDLTILNEGGAPAYASDLMVTAQGNILSVATFGGLRIFAVSGDGFYAETTTKVASGTLDSGRVTYGLPENKTVMSFDTRHHSTGLGSVTPSLSVDGGSFGNLAASSSGTGRKVGAAEKNGEQFEARLTLARSASDTTTGPTVTRWTLFAEPAASDAYFIDVPLMLNTYDQTPGSPTYRDPSSALASIKSLRSSRSPVVYQEGADTFTVSVWDFDFKTHIVDASNPADPQQVGVCAVRLKVLT